VKLAVLSDIHGNLSALEAALADAEAQGAEGFVCLGDVASFGPQPRETLRRAQALGCPVVMGNTDASLLNPRTLESVADPDENTLIFLDIERWSAEQLDKEDLAFVGTFEPTVRLELGSLGLLCFHGSPKSYNDAIVATTPDEQLGEFFEGERATVMLGGHTHAQLLRRYGESVFVNPGSVGLPYEILPNGEARNPPWAEYALLEETGGQPSVTFQRVPYDMTPVLEAARRSGMPHAAWWSADWQR